MSLGLIVKTGRILTARLLMGDPIEGITHCAIGEGDATFTDPLNPPAPEIDQTALKNERARKKFYKRTFLKEDPEGTLVVNGIHYIETSEETQTIGVFFRFEENEANGITIREYGFFGGNVQYVDGVDSDYAANGVYHPDTNPTGEERYRRLVLGDDDGKGLLRVTGGMKLPACAHWLAHQPPEPPIGKRRPRSGDATGVIEVSRWEGNSAVRLTGYALT